MFEMNQRLANETNLQSGFVHLPDLSGLKWRQRLSAFRRVRIHREEAYQNICFAKNQFSICHMPRSVRLGSLPPRAVTVFWCRRLGEDGKKIRQKALRADLRLRGCCMLQQRQHWFSRPQPQGAH